jgi:hypothetical protein
MTSVLRIAGLSTIIGEDIMRIKRLTMSIVILAVICPNLFFGRSLAQSGEKLIEAEKTWEGEIKWELRQETPQNGFIVNEKAWAKLWEAYRGNKLLLPKIDFDKQMILVVLGDGVNSFGLGRLILNEMGDLTVLIDTTLIGGLAHGNPETCRYIFILISREGVKSISGIPVPKG